MPVTLDPIPKLTSPRQQATHLVIAIDSSGSMSSFSRQVVDRFNEQISALRDQAEKLNQLVVVSTLTFGGEIKTLFEHIPIDRIPRLQYHDFDASGGTPLFDAANRAIDILLKYDGREVANLVTILTDGEENQSGWDAVGQFSRNVQKLQATDRWTFGFSVPRGHSKRTLVNQYGIPEGNIQEWEVSTVGFEKVSHVSNVSYRDYLVNRSQGVMRSTSLYNVDVNPQAAVKAKTTLKDVKGDFYHFPVTTQSNKVLQDFVESQGLTFRKGSSFYQLTKTELVQSHKEVLLKELATGKVYGGADARGILGLPKGIDAKVRPADHSDWEIFVQSTSNNRKLATGTTLLYLR